MLRILDSALSSGSDVLLSVLERESARASWLQRLVDGSRARAGVEPGQGLSQQFWQQKIVAGPLRVTVESLRRGQLWDMLWKQG